MIFFHHPKIALASIKKKNTAFVEIKIEGAHIIFRLNHDNKNAVHYFINY